MSILAGGFGWVTGNRVTAPADQSECLLVLTLATPTVVRSMANARGAGGVIVTEPADQPLLSGAIGGVDRLPTVSASHTVGES